MHTRVLPSGTIAALFVLLPLMARYHDFGPFHLWLAKPIDKPDLTGLNLRVSPVYTAFFKALGTGMGPAGGWRGS